MPPPFTDCAERAERLRRDCAEVTFGVGCELDPSTRGPLPGGTLDEQSGRPWTKSLTRR
ncbi:hypothetical protein [Streptomyces olivochromogenes]|uniref:hypothetical protein n=1 Tax=Streptomyces olivochromogenes TaxID=1963 RepID=UPI00368BF3D5